MGWVRGFGGLPNQLMMIHKAADGRNLVYDTIHRRHVDVCCVHFSFIILMMSHV